MTLSDAILATLTYSDHFDSPLTFKELHSRLIGIPIASHLLQTELTTLSQHGALAYTQPYYYLPGRHHLVARRRARALISAPKLALAKRYATLLSRVPGVLAIYLTGSLAMHNAQAEDDIDFMLITQSHALWLTRLTLTLYCELLGIRRRPHGNCTSNQLCLNLYLTPTSLALPTAKRSLYTAYELIQVLPLFDPHQLVPHLLHVNAWLTTFLPNFALPKPQSTLPLSPPPLPIRLAESLAYHLQLLYMRHNLTREFVTPDQAFFHPHNPGSKIIAKLKL